MAKSVSKEEEKKLSLKNEHLREVVMFALAILLLIASAGLTISLNEDWTMHRESRDYVLLFAMVLFSGSLLLCWYVVKTELDVDIETNELQSLLIDSPPSYASILLEPSPPIYMTPSPMLPNQPLNLGLALI